MLGIISIVIWLIGVIICGIYAMWGYAICDWYWSHFSGYYQFFGIPSKDVFYRIQTASVTAMAVLLIGAALVVAVMYFRSK